MKVLLFLSLSCIYSSAIAQEYTIFGYVQDAQTGEVLIGANIYNPKKENGVATNQYGFYSYRTQAGSVTLQISYIGYAPKTITFDLIADTSLTTELEPGDELEEIVIEGQIERLKTKQSLSSAQIKSLPRLGGEIDVLKAFQMLPGVQSGVEGTSGLFVRGGTPDQNLILLDGVPVYNASHLFGFISVFNMEAVNKVDFVKDGFLARYGGRLSSVVDITLKEGNLDKISGLVSMSPVASSLTLNGPIGDKTSYLISGRRTFLDLIARPIIRLRSGGEDDAGYFFYDVNAKINHRINSNNRIYLSLYAGSDRGFTQSASSDSSQSGLSSSFDIFTERSSSYEIEWGNVTTALRWNHIYGPRLFSNLTLTYSKYHFEVSEELNEIRTIAVETEQNNSTISYASGIDDIAIKVDYFFQPNPIHSIRFGGSTISHAFDPGVLGYSTQSQRDTTLGDQQVNAIEYFLYVEDSFKLSEKISGNFGIHFSGFEVQKKRFTSLEPRLSLSYRTRADVLFTTTYSKMKQYVHLLTNSGIGLPTDLWVPSTKKVNPQKADHFTLGVEKTFKDINFSVDGFYKQMENLIEYEEGASYLSVDENWQDKVVNGDGKSYGLETLFKGSFNKWNGWIGYTLSWNNRTFSSLNSGEPFPYRYDRRHDIKTFVNFKPKKGVSYSITWVMHSGNAITLANNQFAVNTGATLNPIQPVFNYVSRNGYRMPAYHRLDIGATWTRPVRWGEQSWSVNIYNAYNRRNPFYIELESKPVYDSVTNQFTKELRFVQYSLFPIIPSINYSLRF